jgi:hypothetical protein
MGIGFQILHHPTPSIKEIQGINLLSIPPSPENRERPAAYPEEFGLEP